MGVMIMFVIFYFSQCKLMDNYTIQIKKKNTWTFITNGKDELIQSVRLHVLVTLYILDESTFIYIHGI